MSDIIYIIKRVIIGVLISIILMYIGSIKVNASSIIQSSYFGINGLVLGNASEFNLNNIKYFNNLGKGRVVFSFKYSPTTESSGNFESVYEVNLNTSTNDLYACDIGNQTNFWDSNKQVVIVSVNCYVDLTNKYINGITYRINNIDSIQGVTFLNSSLITFVGDDPSIQVDTSSIVSAIQQQSQQQLQQSQQAHQDAQQINDAITSEESVSNNEVSENTDDWASNNANNGVINQLVQLPITLLNSIINGLSSSCTSYNFGSLFGTDLIFPCVNMQQVLGSTLWGLIDLIISGIFVYKFGTKLVQIFNNFTNLKGGQVDQLYGGGN